MQFVQGDVVNNRQARTSSTEAVQGGLVDCAIIFQRHQFSVRLQHRRSVQNNIGNQNYEGFLLNQSIVVHFRRIQPLSVWLSDNILLQEQNFWIYVPQMNMNSEIIPFNNAYPYRLFMVEQSVVNGTIVAIYVFQPNEHNFFQSLTMMSDIITACVHTTVITQSRIT